MAEAGIDSTIEVADKDETEYYDVGGADTVSFPMSREELDATSFSHAAFQRIVGIKDASCDISGKYDGDDDGQGELEDGLDSGDSVYVRFRPDGQTGNGYKAEMKVTSFEVSSSADGIVEFSCSLVGTDTDGWSTGE